jgi:SAM-dependent methyltransferase
MDSIMPATPQPPCNGEDSGNRARVDHGHPVSRGQFDLAYSFEVIDEVSDSDRAIRELYRVLKPGGCLLLRLPAFDWLRSSHDTDIGTLHRYTLAEMEEN